MCAHSLRDGIKSSLSPFKLSPVTNRGCSNLIEFGKLTENCKGKCWHRSGFSRNLTANSLVASVSVGLFFIRSKSGGNSMGDGRTDLFMCVCRLGTPWRKRPTLYYNLQLVSLKLSKYIKLSITSFMFCII